MTTRRSLSRGWSATSAAPTPASAGCRTRGRASRRSTPSSATTRPASTPSSAAISPPSGLATPRSCAIGIAAPVGGDVVAMTNRDVDVSRSATCSAAWASTGFSSSTTTRPSPTRSAACGPTRCGASAAARPSSASRWRSWARAPVSACPGCSSRRAVAVPVVGEGGHVSLSAADDREDRVVAILRAPLRPCLGRTGPLRRRPRQPATRRAASSADVRREPLQPADDQRARASSAATPTAAEAVDLFFGFLGSVAGDLALTLGARGGVYIAGGIVAQLGDLIAGSTLSRALRGQGPLPCLSRGDSDLA